MEPLLFLMLLPIILTFVPLLWMSVGVSFGFIDPRKDSLQKIIPNQGIWESLKNSIFIGSLPGLLFGLILGLNFQPIAGVIAGIIPILISGGTACLQHFTLRLILYHNDSIPWNYARFLDYCTERLLLQRIGGRYRFMHKLLQDHFAEMGE